MDALADGAMHGSAIVAMGRRTIATEAEALWALAHDLGQDFADAITVLRRTTGKVIACGLGKSGQIAQKFASTLASTGTPSCFLHAGDAVHGELGVLLPGDTLVILSNSGDTREFGVIMRRALSLAVPIIAITSSPDSPVAVSATVNLLLPPREEACPFGSSPTTSTTMMLALGDALAITLMQMRGIKAADLLELHPGGRLGLDLVRVESFMHGGDELPLVSGEMSMEDVLEVISEKGFGIAGVVDAQQRLSGVITDGDIRRSGISLGSMRANQVMTKRPRILEIGAMARDALTIMSEARITSVFVIQDGLGGRVRGLVHIHDLLRLGIG
ncbi:KpsF/GutQ family sugar-phosphate isomerase [Sphingomonas sp. dw_22]|uniref:KpsF/GutQ family sugar-phosphate isomerase n=1 Tax=Sphingomonas sp. dw_22 TaxID=2721175 RepID=UPI002116042E|nr:KpsF/GutQ family sugar-phosphate isomerase [Sphingomonas sp. dw_22]